MLETYGDASSAEVAFLERLAAQFAPSGARQTARRAASSAPAFAEWLGLTLWPGVERLLASIDANRYTVAETGHGVGKSISVAAAVCWWMSRDDEEAVALTIAPTHAQVDRVLWPHIRHMARGRRLPGRVLDTPRWHTSERKFAVGLSPRRANLEEMASLQGYHSPRLLVVMDEAPGLPQILWDAVRNLAVGERNKVVAIGNPISRVDAFHAACQSEMWNRVHISCLDHPNVVERREVIPGAVSWQWVDEMVRDPVEGHCSPGSPGDPDALEWPPGSGGWWVPDAVFMSRVLGVAPTEGSDQLVPSAWVLLAQQWQAPSTGHAVIALDPCRMGGDWAGLVVRMGARVVHVERRRPTGANPSDELASWLRAVWQRYGGACYVDVIGEGAGAVDAARAMGVPVVDIAFSRSAVDTTRFVNLRAESYWRLRNAFRTRSISIPQDDSLAADLTAVTYGFTSGRIKMAPKDDVKKKLRGRSPDLGDALAMTYSEATGEPLPDGAAEELIRPQPGRWRPDAYHVTSYSPGRWRRGRK